MEEVSLIEIIKNILGLKEKSLEDFTKEEIEFFKNIADLRELSVSDFLIPRNQLDALNEDWDWEEIKDYVIKNPRFYYPVYKSTLDHYTGYISLKDLVRGFSYSLYNWKDYTNPALTLPENLSVLKAIEKLKERDLELAFIVDEHSEFVGIFKIEDIFKYLLFSPAKCFRVDPEGWIKIPATTKLHLLEKCLGLTFPEGDYDTLSGFILSQLDRIPKKGEKFIFPPIEVEILEADERKINEVRLKKIL
ncbi:MAG: transporter associated domain-containing protein [Caldimicrobium sp.]|jgi:CBS domain containing-hemolysin-like protein